MIDTHAHLFLCKEPSEIIIRRAKEAGVQAIINPGIDVASSRQAIETFESFNTAFPAVGIHPSGTKEFPKLEEIESLAKTHPVVAIGEIGLDYFKMYAEKEDQIKLFEAQLEIARTLNLPVIIHNRHSDDDVIAIVKNFPTVPKVFHCFGSGPAVADALMTENHLFSFTGSITYSRKGKTIQSLKAIPIEKIMIETDAPYLTPKAFKGQANQPANVSEIAKKIAEIKNVSFQQVVETTTKNAISFFSLPLTN
jgi:TatD DNase family protein